MRCPMVQYREIDGIVFRAMKDKEMTEPIRCVLQEGHDGNHAAFTWEAERRPVA